MNTDRQKIAIAEACGWNHVHLSECWGNVVIGTKAEPYTNVLTDEQHSKYRGQLVEVCESLADALCATPPQRAEAFLRTLDLWESETVAAANVGGQRSVTKNLTNKKNYE